MKPAERGFWLLVLARAMAFFFGGFSLLNWLGELKTEGYSASLLLMDLRWWPPAAEFCLSLFSAIVMLLFGLFPALVGRRRILTVGCAVALGSVALLNSVQFFCLLARGSVGAGFPLPFSLLAALGWGIIAVVAARKTPAAHRTAFWPCLGCSALLTLVFPLTQMFCFGKTDYRRPADVVVVFGARVYADGQLSDALADRVRTACDLYRDGMVKQLIVSGGPGDGRIHETEAMKRMAVQLGVKPEDILQDYGGTNTRKTVEHTCGMLRQAEASRILVVSHFYHLPRIKLAYQRAGVEVLTVPARESYLLRQLPYNMVREVAAFWSYYLQPPQVAAR